MKVNVFWLMAATALAIAGCNKAESPADVRHDVADAQAEAQRDVADARADAQQDMADARQDVEQARANDDAGDMSGDMSRGDVADQAQQANEEAAQGEYRVAVAQAEAAHKVATEKCDAMSGAAQEDCKQRADS